MQCHSYGNTVDYHHLFHDGHFETCKNISESSKGLTDDDAMPPYQTLQLRKCSECPGYYFTNKTKRTVTSCFHQGKI